MATTSNERLVEGLYAMGYPVDMLMKLDRNLPVDQFRRNLNNQGITNEKIDMAAGFVNWRSGAGTTYDNLHTILNVMGRHPSDWERISKRAQELSPTQGMKDNNALAKAMDEVLGREVSGAIRVKIPGLPTGGGNTPGGPVAAAIWNPFRGDNPIKGTEIKYGAHGVITGIIPEGMSAIEPPTPKVAVPPGMPQPGRNVRAGVPPAPGTTMKTGQPGAPGGPVAPAGIDQAPGTGGGGGGGVPDTRPIWQQQGRKPTPEEFDQYVRTNFGYQAWWIDVPEVRQKLFEMTEQGLTDPQEAQRRISQTEWWKNTSAAARTWWANERADPASTQSDITEQTATFQTLAQDMGVDVEPTRLRAIAEASLRFGWNQAQIKRAIGNEFHYDPNNRKQGAKVSEIKAAAAKYMVPLSDDTLGTWAKGLITGDYSEDEFGEYLKASAKSMFPQLTAAIDAGHTVEDYVNPYKQIAAQRLEIPPDQINFMDPKWRSALQVADPKTGQNRVMTLTEWESHIKTDPAYGYDKTQQGVGEAAKLAEELAHKFGQVA